MQQGRERISKLNDAARGDDRSEASKIGDCSRNDVSDGPVHRDEESPSYFPSPVGQGRSFEELDGNVVIEYLYADVAVEASSDEGTDDSERVTGGLPGVCGDTEI